MVIFGGDGEDRMDPRDVEVMWPGYDDGFDDSGYVTIGSFDPLPESYGSFLWTSAVLMNDSIIMACGGGYPATNKCFGLNLVSGSWATLPSMTYARTESSYALVRLIDSDMILALGGGAKIEVHDPERNAHFWYPMPEWSGRPFHRHCAVALDDHQVMVVGALFPGWQTTVSMILDIQTGKWKDTAPIPNPRQSLACVLTTIGNKAGVMVTGGTDRKIDPSDYYPASQTDFYQLATDSWVSLANSSFPVEEHQIVIVQDKPTIIGGQYQMFERKVEAGGIHMRDHVQIYLEEKGGWDCCVPAMNHRRAKFAAVLVKM